MNITFRLLFLLLLCAPAQAQDFGLHDYEKIETYITTRDKVALYTAIYQPKARNRKFPILLTRTPYGCAPYGKAMPEQLLYNELLVRKGYIFVFQDLRGRGMSDGEDMINLKPVYSLQDKTKTDEATDAYDTIDWLVKHLKNSNGKAGLYGNSYRGWTALMGAVGRHPALKAVQAGAPCVSDYFDDFSRYGLFTLGYTPIIDWFGTRKTKREPGAWWESKKDYFSFYESYTNKLDYDSYLFFLKKGALKNYTTLLSDQNYFYTYLKQHPNYDEARKERNALQYLRNLNCPVLLVGGWNDEQNLYGVTQSYEVIARNNKAITCYVAGPWNHGDYRLQDSAYAVGNIFYGYHLNRAYLEKEFHFFEHFLNGQPDPITADIAFFNTGTKTWSNFSQLPQTTPLTFYFHKGEGLSQQQAGGQSRDAVFEFISDPAKPVPYTEQDEYSLFVSRSFMTDDQRFAGKRPDVLTFCTESLPEDLTISGKINALLQFSTDHGDADLIVKLIDVLPENRAPEPTDKAGIKMNGYQQLVRCGYIRGRYRNSFSVPEPFVPNTVSTVPVELLPVHHTFKKGHKIMVQVQSSLFPLFDRNPQKYVDNIFNATDADFEKATHKIYPGSKIILPVL